MYKREVVEWWFLTHPGEELSPRNVQDNLGLWCNWQLVMRAMANLEKSGCRFKRVHHGPKNWGYISYPEENHADSITVCDTTRNE